MGQEKTPHLVTFFLDSQLSSLKVISASRSLGQKTSSKNRKPEDSLTRLKR
uniref:Uncharacterized protein n=1 Tax=Theropithecus gelada TaxID=9565 RepID=A0A8D2FS54_THEGE